jgi:hypothetical protein
MSASVFGWDAARPWAATSFVSRKKTQKAQKEAIARMESWSVEQCS